MSLLITINDDLVAKVLWYRQCLNSFLEPAHPHSENHIVPKQQKVFPRIRYQVFHLNKQYILRQSCVEGRWFLGVNDFVFISMAPWWQAQLAWHDAFAFCSIANKYVNACDMGKCSECEVSKIINFWFWMESLLKVVVKQEI